jgi:hypothetical protein
MIVGKNLTLIDSQGQSTDLHISQEEKFTDVMNWLECYYQANQETIEIEKGLSTDLALTLVVSNNDVIIKQQGTKRDYYAGASKRDRKDIDFIVNKLAYESLISLAGLRSELKERGKRINHLHPFNFLTVIFTDEKMKVGVQAIRNRSSWIWDEFLSGNITSLAEESKKDNLKDEHIRDFSRKIGVDFSLIASFIKQQKWKEFINYLIDNVPRENDPNRYNM